jgi:hypothetical protein
MFGLGARELAMAALIAVMNAAGIEVWSDRRM